MQLVTERAVPTKVSFVSQTRAHPLPSRVGALRVWTDEERESLYEMAESAPKFDVGNETIRP